MNPYWKNFQESHPGYLNDKLPLSFYFCDNKKDADECADLVVKGIKRATSPSLWSIEKNNEKIPSVGDIAIVTDWAGIPKAIIKNTDVSIVNFQDITSDYAFIEGEGDRSLAYWQAVHLAYYKNEMRVFGEEPRANMPIVCVTFERIG